MYVQLFSYWLVGLSAAYWLGENLWGVYGYWTGICVGLGTASVLLGLRLWHSSGMLIRQNRPRVDHPSAGTHSL